MITGLGNIVSTIKECKKVLQIVSFGHRLFYFFSSYQQSKEKTTFGKLVQADMISVGCAIVEMLMPGKVQLSTCGLTGKHRERAIIKLCETNSKHLPRFVK